MNGAETALKKELVISPHDSMTYAALGKIAATRNAITREAETYLKKAISFGSQKSRRLSVFWGRCISPNRSAEAETALRQCIRLTTDVSLNRYQVQKAHFLLGRILMQKGEQDEAHAQMKISRDLANKTLAQDKTKLAGLMDTSGIPMFEELWQKTGHLLSIAAALADPVALRKIETLRSRSSSRSLTATTIWALSRQRTTTIRKRSDTSSGPRSGIHRSRDSTITGVERHSPGRNLPMRFCPLSRYLKSHPDDTGARSVLAISQFMAGNYHGCIETMRARDRKD